MRGPRSGGSGRPGGQADFDEFYEACYARLVGQLLAVTGSLEQAQDVVQEAFLRALTSWPRVRSYEVPELWVRRVAINLAISEIRRARRRLAAMLRLGPPPPVPPLTADALTMLELLRGVPVNQRPVLLLHAVLDLPLEQVARELELPVSTVRGRLARARAHLARIARDREGALIEGE